MLWNLNKFFFQMKSLMLTPPQFKLMLFSFLWMRSGAHKNACKNKEEATVFWDRVSQRNTSECIVPALICGHWVLSASWLESSFVWLGSIKKIKYGARFLIWNRRREFLVFSASATKEPFPADCSQSTGKPGPPCALPQTLHSGSPGQCFPCSEVSTGLKALRQWEKQRARC